MSNIGKPVREITVEPLEMPAPLRREAPDSEPRRIDAPVEEPVKVGQ